MTHELIFKLPKESYSIAIGPCSAKSRKCKDPNYGLNKEIKVQLRRGKQGKLEYFSNN